MLPHVSKPSKDWNNVHVPTCPVHSIIPNSIVSSAWNSVRGSTWISWEWNIGGTILIREKRNTGRETRQSSILSTSNVTGSNLRLSSKKSANNQLVLQHYLFVYWNETCTSYTAWSYRGCNFINCILHQMLMGCSKQASTLCNFKIHFNIISSCNHRNIRVPYKARNFWHRPRCATLTF